MSVLKSPKYIMSVIIAPVSQPFSNEGKGDEVYNKSDNRGL